MGDRVCYILLLYILLFHFKTIYGQKTLFNLTNSNESLDNFVNSTYDLNKPSETEICKIKTCINKCCPENRYVVSIRGVKTCIEYKNNFTFDFSSIYVYDKDMTRVMTTIGNSTEMHLVPGKFLNDRFKRISFNGGGFPGYNTYLTEDGVFNLEVHNTYERWIPIEKDHFCVDYQISRKGKLPAVRVWIEWNIPVTAKGDITEMKNFNYKLRLLESHFEKETTSVHKPEAEADLSPWISCVFLFTVLVIYWLLPELRNLCGLIPIAYVASLFCAYLLLAIIQLVLFKTEDCIRLTLSIYFFFMSSFCWINVMSYDIWWTFRGYAKSRPNHLRGEYFKFAMYCLYAWGLPLGMTIFTSIMNTINLKDKPWIIQPNIGKTGCFIEGHEKIFYLYLPIFILILSDWLFHLMTAFNMWQLKRRNWLLEPLDSAVAESPAARRTQRQRFVVYLKVSIVMGLNWVLEVGRHLNPALHLWNLNETYKLLMGLFIFLIFFCKTNIYRRLTRRFEGYKTRWSLPSKNFASNTSGSSSALDVNLPVVCSSPIEPAYTK